MSTANDPCWQVRTDSVLGSEMMPGGGGSISYLSAVHRLTADLRTKSMQPLKQCGVQLRKSNGIQEENSALGRQPSAKHLVQKIGVVLLIADVRANDHLKLLIIFQLQIVLPVSGIAAPMRPARTFARVPAIV